MSFNSDVFSCLYSAYACLVRHETEVMFCLSQDLSGGTWCQFVPFEQMVTNYLVKVGSAGLPLCKATIFPFVINTELGVYFVEIIFFNSTDDSCLNQLLL